jgi:hypothetical protein
MSESRRPDMKLSVLLLVVLAGVGFAAERLTNGSFEMPLAPDWTQTVLPDYSTYEIEQATAYHPDADNEVLVYKYDADVAKIEQTVSVTDVNLYFGYSAKMTATEFTPTESYWAAAAIWLFYKNEFGAVLGETRIVFPTFHCPWSSSPTVHLITVPDTLWHDGLLDIAAELGNLPGVNPADVKQITVAIGDTTDGC